MEVEVSFLLGVDACVRLMASVIASLVTACITAITSTDVTVKKESPFLPFPSA